MQRSWHLLCVCLLLAIVPGAWASDHFEVMEVDGVVEHASGPAELMQIETTGQMSVRALRGFDRLPDRFAPLILDLRRQGIDLLGAGPNELRRLAARAETGDLASDPQPLRDLLSLLEKQDYYDWERLKPDTTITLNPGDRLRGDGHALLQQGTDVAISIAPGGRVVVAEDAIGRPGTSRPTAATSSGAGNPGRGAGAAATTLDRTLFEMPVIEPEPVQLPPPFDLSTLTDAQWAGSVSMAREAMLMIYGEMSPDDRAKFDAKWNPLFEFPSQAVVDYFNQLQPLLAQFLSIRRAMANATLTLDRLQFELADLTAYGDLHGIAERLRAMGLIRAQMQGFVLTGERIAAAIAALGDPPDAKEEQQAARRTHQDLMRLFAGGSGLEGEWVGQMENHPVKGELDLFDSLGGVFDSDSFKESLIEQMTPEEREQAAREEARRAALWESGQPIPAADADAFPIHLIFTSHEDADGNTVWHSYRFDALDRDDQTGRTPEDAARDLARTANWLSVRNMLWPPFDEGSNHWSLEWISRNPADWLETWQFEFDVEANHLRITELGHYSPQRMSFNGTRKLGGQLYRHRTYELRRVARPARQARPTDWSLDAAIRAVNHPSAVWALQGVNIERAEQRYPNTTLEVSGDGLQSTVTHVEKVPVFTPIADPCAGRSGCVSIPSVDDDPDGPAQYRDQLYRATQTITKTPPKTLRPGDVFHLAGTAVAEPLAEGTQWMGNWTSSMGWSDYFSGSDAGLTGGVKGGIEADAAKESVQHFSYQSDPIQDWPYEAGQTREVRISGGTTFGGEHSVNFVYAAVPDGQEHGTDAHVRVYGAGLFGQGSGSTPPGEPDPAQLEQIKFHETNITYFSERIARLEKEMAAERDGERHQQLLRDLLYQQDARQREQDQIVYIKTGEYRHTRTEADAFNQALMAEQGRQMADHFETLQRVLERVPRLIATAPPEDQQQLRDFFYRQVNASTIAEGDLTSVRKAAASIGESISGIHQREQAKAEEALAWEDYKTASAETVKGAADFSLMALSSAAGPPGWGVFAGYAAYTTGYLDGNPAEAVRQSLTGISIAAATADQIFQGYQQGVVQAYETYAANPDSGPVNETQAGLAAAGWEGAKTLVMAGVMKLGLRFLAGPAPPPTSTGKIVKFKGSSQTQGWMDFDDFQRLRDFQQARAVGQQRLEHFQALSERYRTLKEGLRARGLSLSDLDNNPELTVLQRRIQDAYGLVKTDYHAKLLLNQSGNQTLLKTYNSVDETQMMKVRERLAEIMKAEGYAPQRYKLFSNSASSGKAGMDIDLGVDETAAEFAKGLFRTEGGVTRKVSRLEFREAGQRNLKAAFREVTGHEMDEPFLLFTHSQHPEAYKKGADYWLGSKTVKHAVVDEIDKVKGWTQQAGSVTRFKVDELNNLVGKPGGLDYYTTLQEQCRGLVKDFDTKLGPFINRSTHPPTKIHAQELYIVMEQFAKNEIGPIEADRRIRILTGGGGVSEITQRFQFMLEGWAGTAATHAIK